MRASWLCVLLALVAACGSATSSSPEPAGSCVAGDPSEPLEIEVSYVTTNGELMTATNMVQVPLVQAPQGGKMLVVGARVRNVRSCNVTLRAALVDRETGSVASLDRRSVTLERGEDGWLRPHAGASSSLSSLPACPRANLSRDIDGEAYKLQVAVEDGAGHSAKAEVMVVPECADDDADCRCLCAKGYVLGSCGGAVAEAGAP